MNRRLYEKELTERFDEDFTKEFEELCEKHNINDSRVVNEMHEIIQYERDREDIISWLENDSCYPSLAEDEGFVDYLIFQYRSLYDNEYDIWYNITSAFDRVKDMPEWKYIVEIAYVEDY